MLKAIYPPLLLLCLSVTLGYAFLALFYVGVPILVLDARSRYSEYKTLLKTSCLGRRRSLINRMQYSWCSRTAAIAACGARAKKIYAKLGYRWYHILPVGAPLCFFKLRWWKKVIL